MAEIITLKDLHELLEHFAHSSYLCSHIAAEGSLDYRIMAKVEALYKLDYSLVELENKKSALCIRYPERIFIPEAEHGHQMSNTLINNSTQTTAMETLTEATATTTITYATNGSGAANANANMANNTCNVGAGNVQQFVTFADHVDSSSSQELTPTSTPLATSINTALPTAAAPAAFPNTTQQQPQHTIYEAHFDIGRVRDLISNARYARCRNRFVVPVMLYRGKFICRSATISLPSEQHCRKILDAVTDTASNLLARLGGNDTTSNNKENGNGTNGTNGGPYPQNGDEAEHDSELDDPVADRHLAAMQQNSNTPPPTFSNEEVTRSDIELLRALNVNTIFDLMVENYKTKFLVAVSSSEKADEQQRYRDFAIVGIPYPGCEFFKKFRDNNYTAPNLFYNWKQSFIDTRIKIPASGPAAELDINWSHYEKWDLVTMTQNYLKAMLKYIQDDNAGLLVHCISGWDRTPLFISLIRLSLWADGLIHQSLGPMEMAYLTLAYDWYLFGHQLPNRLGLGEDILIFCFHVLKYLWSDDFRVTVGGSTHRKRTKTSSSSSSSVVVIRPDGEEEQRDDFLLDMDSNESSNCDTPFGESFYVCPLPGGTAPIVQQPQSQQLQSQASSSSSSPAQMLATSTTPMTSFAGALTQANAVNGNNTTALQTGRSPNLKRTRTSPIAVPNASAINSASRQRHDSNSLSSWMIVSGAGSIDSMRNGVTMSENMEANASVVDGLPHNTAFGSINSNGSNISVDGVCGPIDGLRPPLTLRRQRLENLRNIVIPAYSRMVGLRFNEGSTGFINSMIENLF